MNNIDHKLIHYNTRAAFERDKSRIPYESIVFIDEDRTIYTHGTEYNTAVIEKYIKEIDKDLSDAMKKSHQDLLDLINELSKYVEDMYKKDVDDWSKQYEEAIAQMDEIRRKLAELTSNQGSAQIDIDDINARIQLMTQYWNKLNGTYTNLQAQIDAMKGVADINGEWFNTIENMINTFKSEVNLQLGTFRTELENLDLDARIKRLVGREMNAPDGIIYDYVKQIVGTNTDPDAIEQAVEVWFNALDPSWAELTSKVSANETALAGMRSEIDGNEAKWTAFTSWKRGVDSDIAAFKASSGDDESFAEMFAQHFNEATGEDFMASIFAYANNEGSEIEAIADFINMIAGKVQLTAPTMEFTTELLNFIAEQINATGNLDVAKSLSVGTGNNKISIDGTNGIKHAGNGFLLKLDGSGLVANGNISWDANGNVTLRNTHIDIPTASGGNTNITYFVTFDYRQHEGYLGESTSLDFCEGIFTVCKSGYTYIDPTSYQLMNSNEITKYSNTSTSEVAYGFSGDMAYRIIRAAQTAAYRSKFFNEDSDEPITIAMTGQTHLGNGLVRIGSSIVFNTTVKHLMHRICGTDVCINSTTTEGNSIIFDLDNATFDTRIIPFTQPHEDVSQYLENGNMPRTIRYAFLENSTFQYTNVDVGLYGLAAETYPYGANSLASRYTHPFTAGYLPGDIATTIVVPDKIIENGVSYDGYPLVVPFDNNVYSYRAVDPRCVFFWKLGEDGIWKHIERTDCVLGGVIFDYAGQQTSGDNYTQESVVMDRLNNLLNTNFPNANVGDKVIVSQPRLSMHSPLNGEGPMWVRFAAKTETNGWIYIQPVFRDYYKGVTGYNGDLYNYKLTTLGEIASVNTESIEKQIYNILGYFSNSGEGLAGGDFLYV